MKNFCILVAGGTGGHINAAIGLGEKLSELNFETMFVSGKRPLDYKLFDKKNVLHIPSEALRSKSPINLLKAIMRNILSLLIILKLIIRKRPRFIVGAGGYVCGATLLAGWLLRVPIFIIEQNAVMGVTNKILSSIANLIFIHFKDTVGIKPSMLKKVKVIGNPIRKSIQYFPPRTSRDSLNILVFGGSLGANQINMIIYDLIQKDYQFPISIIHQIGPEKTADFVLGKNVTYQKFQYLDEIDKNYNWCDIIIARAGASTVAELRVVGKPCYLVPFPAATDNHQYFNAKALKDENLFEVEFNTSSESDLNIMKNIESFIGKYLNNSLLSPKKTSKVLDTSNEMTEAIKKYVGIT